MICGYPKKTNWRFQGLFTGKADALARATLAPIHGDNHHMPFYLGFMDNSIMINSEFRILKPELIALIETGMCTPFKQNRDWQATGSIHGRNAVAPEKKLSE